MRSIKVVALLAVGLLIAQASAFAQIEVKEDGTSKGRVNKINFTTNTGVSVSGPTATVSGDLNPTITGGSITGVTVNNSVIGGVTPAAGSFTSVNASGDVTFKTSLLALGKVDALLQLSSSSTVITLASVPYCVIRKNVGAGTGGKDTLDGGTRLANATKGQVLSIIISSLGGSSYWDLTPITATGWSKLRFDTVTDMATLLYVNDTFGWIIVSNSGAVITLPTNFASGQEPGP